MYPIFFTNKVSNLTHPDVLCINSTGFFEKDQERSYDVLTPKIRPSFGKLKTMSLVRCFTLSESWRNQEVKLVDRAVKEKILNPGVKTGQSEQLKIIAFGVKIPKCTTIYFCL